MSLPISKEKQEEWKNKIRQQKNSGKGVLYWCLEHQVERRAFYY